MIKNKMTIFVNIYVVFVLAGWIAIQPVSADIVSHEGTATIKGIDLEKGIVKLAHGPVASLKWSAMTMNFIIEDRSLMQGIRVNDAVIFTFTESNGKYAITSIKLIK